MDGDAFRDRLEREHAERLGAFDSPELLVALADGKPTPTPLLEAAANSEHAAQRTFEQWAETEQDAAARDAFEDSAQQEHRHYQLVVDELSQDYEPADGGPLHAYLRGREETIQRVATGMVGRSLVSLRTHARLIEYFEGERAALFVELRDETEATLHTGLSLLDTICTGKNWERAEMAASYVIRVAHEDYVDSLAAIEHKESSES
ncbi:hypothetical protein [Natranaeroarchaeum aerophilus]|uniref:Rubrerythrin family protein n=1 Tax=Natranaeroarchaeum aerophilus TaxID=2917711 RepID=A0AAE3FSS5_9EURY|nr:hypothetical protein [Natranaeroarchaeum aerophilus]MCL9814470.1 hypothetical protein [Natranaeroarchaeum aerophilus]